MGRRRVVFFAFGTRGDVLPLAVVAAALTQAKEDVDVVFITHEGHRNMKDHLARSRVSFVGVSAPALVPGQRILEMAGSEEDEGQVKAAIEHQLREECIAAMEGVMAGSADGGGSCRGIVINLFALEGWHLAELYRLPCAVMAPYVVPYSAPSSFQRLFRAMHPMLYRRLLEAVPGEVGWGEIMHWMWPLFTDRWAAWRSHRLHLSACPFTDPVTELPCAHDWPRASPLLYGFSREVVECPRYWPRSIFVCGFWYAPLDWDASNSSLQLVSHTSDLKGLEGLVALNEGVRNNTLFAPDSATEITPENIVCNETKIVSEIGDNSVAEFLEMSHSNDPNINLDTKLLSRSMQLSESPLKINSQHKSEVTVGVNPKPSLQSKSTPNRSILGVYTAPIRMQEFLLNKHIHDVQVSGKRLIFVGLSSMGSMGFLENLDCMLIVLEGVLHATDSRAILLTAGHHPLDLAVANILESRQGKSKLQKSSVQQRINMLKEGLCCFDGHLFCYSGPVPYLWLLPQCSVAIHHGGSGTTAACLRSGVPQIICPFVLDQFYWAERMAWLGVAPQPLKAHHLMPDLHAESIVNAVSAVTCAVLEACSDKLKQCASSLRDKIEVEDGTSLAVQILTAELCS